MSNDSFSTPGVGVRAPGDTEGGGAGVGAVVLPPAGGSASGPPVTGGGSARGAGAAGFEIWSFHLAAAFFSFAFLTFFPKAPLPRTWSR